MKNIKNDLIDAVEVTFNAANAEPNEKVFYFTSPEEFNNETTIKIVNGNIAYSKTEKTPRKRLTYAGIVRNCKNGMSSIIDNLKILYSRSNNYKIHDILLIRLSIKKFIFYRL